MKKRLLLILVATYCASSYISAGISDFEYTYTEPDADISAIGNKTAETIDVAIKIDNPALAGMQIKQITAYTNTVDFLSNTSVWISNSLNLENNVNVPDVLSQHAPIHLSEFCGEEVGAIEYTFDEPYTLTASPVYVGYSMSVEKAGDMGTNYPVIISKVKKSNSFFLHTSGVVNYWQDSSATGAAAIVVTLSRDDVEYNLGITQIQEAYSASEENFHTFVTLCNTGSLPIKKFTYSYSFDEGDVPVISNYELDEEIMPDVNNFTTVKLPFESKETIGEHEVYFNITEVNGEPNSSVAAESSFKLNTFSFLPVHRPLVEEYTGLWCGYCPRGYIAMEYVDDTFGDDQVSICFHNKDVMTVTTAYPMNVSNFPNASVDRMVLIDPYYGTSGNDLGILEDVRSAIDKVAFASIDVNAELEGDDINISTEVIFNKDFDSSPYLIGYILTCDGLIGENWNQTNYYHNNGSLKDTPLEPLMDWPARAPGLIYNDVAVDVDGMRGEAMSLPEEIKALEKYSHEFKYNIKGNTLVQNPANLRVNAYIVDRSSDKVMNANKCRVSSEAGIETIHDSTEVKSVVYYDLSGVVRTNPANGIFIKVTTLSNGKTVTEKVKV